MPKERDLSRFVWDVDDIMFEDEPKIKNKAKKVGENKEESEEGQKISPKIGE